MGNGCFSRGKAAGTLDCSLTSDYNRVKKDWSYISTPRVCLHGVYRDSCTFYLVGFQDKPYVRNVSPSSPYNSRHELKIRVTGEGRRGRVCL
jgi:hypothetical protein